MTMRSTVFKPGGLKIVRDLNPGKPAFEKAQSGGCAAASAASAGINIKREPGEPVLEPGHDGGLPAVLGNIHNSANQHQHHHSKNRKLKENNANKNKTGSRNLGGAAGPNKAQGVCLGLGQGKTWLSLEGIHNNVFITGQTANNIKTITGTPVNTTTTANAKKSSREPGGTEAAAAAGGAGSLELNMESKWKNVKKSPTQATCLRQILLLQLDLIEQQQQQLQTKDKEIDELKSEKETLLARMERMERRMQLVKKDNSKERQKLFQPLELEGLWAESEHSEGEEPQEGGAETPQLPSPKPMPFGRGGKGHKRKFGFWNTKTPVKKLTSEFTKARSKTPKFSPLKESEPGGAPFQWELRSKETPEKVSAAARVQGDSPTPLKESPPSLQPREEPHSTGVEPEELPFMSTTEMYLCRWQQPPPSPRRETTSNKEESVAIPSWREHSMEPLKDVTPPDFIENLDDGVFLKRHAKLEQDEKRRKRWDIQRIREQRMFQRLQQRMFKKKGIQESEPEVSSFFPETDDVESLMITPFLPVVAFGRPLPKLTQQNFELPWLDERSRCRIEMQKKQTPHRTCRK